MTGHRLLLLDAASLYFRAFYGVPDRRDDPSTPPNNAVRGFVDMVATLLTDHRPSHLVACWDDDWRPAFRVEAIPTYKAHRVAEDTADGEQVPDALSVQVPAIREVLAAAGLARVGVAGHEADDVIGSYAAQWRDRMPIDVVTGDRDLFQLVDDQARIRVLYTAKGGVRSPDVIDQQALRQRYGVDTGPAYAEMSMLRGDSSDGLPGVKGIGDKTAAALIATHGSLARLLADLAAGDSRLTGARRANLEAATDYLARAPRVVTVVPDLPIPDDVCVPPAPADPAALGRLVATHDLAGPVNRLLAALDLR